MMTTQKRLQRKPMMTTCDSTGIVPQPILPLIRCTVEVPGRLTAATVITDLGSEAAEVTMRRGTSHYTRLAIPAAASMAVSIYLSIYVASICLLIHLSSTYHLFIIYLRVYLHLCNMRIQSKLRLSVKKF